MALLYEACTICHLRSAREVRPYMGWGCAQHCKEKECLIWSRKALVSSHPRISQRYSQSVVPNVIDCWCTLFSACYLQADRLLTWKFTSVITYVNVAGLNARRILCLLSATGPPVESLARVTQSLHVNNVGSRLTSFWNHWSTVCDVWASRYTL